jgi:hypothetical protein
MPHLQIKLLKSLRKFDSPPQTLYYKFMADKKIQQVKLLKKGIKVPLSPLLSIILFLFDILLLLFTIGLAGFSCQWGGCGSLRMPTLIFVCIFLFIFFFTKLIMHKNQSLELAIFFLISLLILLLSLFFLPSSF